jgi:HlyD family secretion protein
MDKKIKKKIWTLKRLSLIAFGVLFFSFILYNFIWADRRSKLNVNREKITIATVDRGPFQEYIPQTGTVFPKETFYLDAIEGGTIKRVVKESGANVNPGDVIVELSNLNRELTVMSQEASYNESINRVRQTRLGVTQNDLQQKAALAQIENQLAILKPQYEREKILFEKGLIAQQQFERTKADYE